MCISGVPLDYSELKREELSIRWKTCWQETAAREREREREREVGLGWVLQKREGLKRAQLYSRLKL